MAVREKKSAQVICFANHKGGVGKTCSVCNAGAGLARKGQRVLLVDLDPQANLSLSLGALNKGEVDGRNIYRALIGDCKAAEAIYNVTENLDIIPSHLDLSGAEIELSSESGREFILRELLDDLTSVYDLILIDCAPSFGLLTLNAMTASNEVYIPVQAQFLALQGLSKISEIVQKVRKRLNKKLSIGGVVLTQFDKRKVLSRQCAETVRNKFGEKVFKSEIRENVALAEAPTSRKDIFRYNASSYGAQDYDSLSVEILKRLKLIARSNNGKKKLR